MDLFAISPLVVLLLVQAVLMSVDEFLFHRRRGLGLWERLGHPLDTLSVLGCFLIAAFAQFRPGMVDLYLVLAAVSCLIVTKDEFVHNRECKAGEQWLHALLFVMHPLVLGAGFFLWVDRVGVIPEGGIAGQYVLSSLWSRVSVGPWTASLVLYAQCAAVGLFLLYQVNHYVLLGRGKRRNSSNFKQPNLEAEVPAPAQAENHGDLIRPPLDADGKGIL